MLTINFSPADLILALYPEIHYRFRGFKFSRYFRREPEIVVDIPHRVEAPSKIPVLLLVKDAHLFPVQFSRPLKLITDCSSLRDIELHLPADTIDSPWWRRTFELDLPPGEYRIWAEISYRVGGKSKRALNHNFRGLPPAPLRLRVSNEPLPRPAGYLLGDIHCHSNYTADQVEYGAPLRPLARAAKAMGLDFACVTDHSYDLDDVPGDPLAKDPELRKWSSFLKEAAEISNAGDESLAHIVHGQEVTVTNSAGRNVHLLLFGGDRFFPGSGDSAEKWFKTETEYSIEDLVSAMSGENIAGAAHPWDPVRLLQKLFLKRGLWEESDFIEGISGAQIANGTDFRQALSGGIPRWREMLKLGRRTALWAGNDSHGNFNIFRQVKLPMWKLWQNYDHILGAQWTGVHSPDGVAGLFEGLRRGGTYITNGPGIEIRVNGNRMGETVASGERRVIVDAVSSEEFGRLKSVSLFTLEGEEFRERQFSASALRYTSREIRLDLNPGFAYAAAETEKGFQCATSAVFLR